jgi:hypothetical protein
VSAGFVIASNTFNMTTASALLAMRNDELNS